MALPLDPASVASYVAAAKARADDGVFAVGAITTTRGYGYSRGIAEAIALAYRPTSQASARLFSWSIRYRMRKLSGFLVADVAYTTQATGLLALAATDAMNTVDLRYPLPQTPNAMSKWPA